MSKLMMLLSSLLSLGKGTRGMEQTLVYPAIHPADDSIKTKDQPECKELIIDIPLALEASRCPDQYCIYRIPKRLREVNNMAYTPRLVSIGPFHHRSEELKDMDIQKFLILKNFCNRPGKSIEKLKCIIRPKEEKIRSCYSETFLLSSEGFLNMILLDAIFILELFYRKYEKDSGSSKAQKDSDNSKAHYQIDYILSQPCMERGIQHDLLLLENQLPLFVLEELYQKCYQNGEKSSTDLLKLSCRFFGDLYNKQPEPKKSRCHVKHCFTDLVGCCCHPPDPNQRSLKRVEVKHFTDLVRYFFLPLDPNQSTREPVQYYKDLERYFLRPISVPNQEKQKEGPKEIELNKRTNKHLHGTATKLDEAGLKFTRPDSERDLLDIKYRPNECFKSCRWQLNLSWLLSCLPFLKHTCLVDMQCFLEVPTLLLDDKTEGLFRNLMALEQCHYPSKTYICDYIVLLDDLITTKEDVRLLVEKKIIVNELGSSAAVTKLVNNLALEIEESGTHYADLCEKVNDYYKSSWNRLVGILTRTYFSDFFKGTATVVGIIVLFLTLWNFQRLIRLSTGSYQI
ncbi:hypothetical protein I3760_14G025500 [Carya illinoinensis]|nr:hypothetical protein I3760_14G025500 [Carya illinoinensis]